MVSPVFWMVSAWAGLVSPTGVEKVNPEVGLNASCACVPVPVSETSLLTSVAPLYGMVRSAASAPGSVGANLTMIVHEPPPAASTLPSHPPVTW